MSTPHGSTDYQGALQGLLPRGAAWPRDPESRVGALVVGLADEFCRREARARDLVEEAFPDTTDEILSDWERVAGLPDPAIPAPVTLDDRRAALAQRLVGLPAITAADFIALAADLGYPGATIAYHTPFAADVSAADDLLYEGDSVFWWEMTIHVPAGTATPLAVVEHYVRAQAPDHTYPTFIYVTP